MTLLLGIPILVTAIAAVLVALDLLLYLRAGEDPDSDDRDWRL